MFSRVGNTRFSVFTIVSADYECGIAPRPHGLRVPPVPDSRGTSIQMALCMALAVSFFVTFRPVVCLRNVRCLISGPRGRSYGIAADPLLAGYSGGWAKKGSLRHLGPDKLLYNVLEFRGMSPTCTS
jgi:hypothetical protein